MAVGHDNCVSRSRRSVGAAALNNSKVGVLEGTGTASLSEQTVYMRQRVYHLFGIVHPYCLRMP